MASHGTEPLPIAPYSLDLLADLHAGALPESVSDRLWPLVENDIAAMEVITALDSVSSQLRELGSETGVGEPIPPEVAERIDRVLATAIHPVPDDQLASARRRRFSRTTVAVGIAATVAAAIALTVAVTTTYNNESRTDVTAGAPPMIISSDSIDDAIAYQVMASRGENALIESGHLGGCLAVNGFDPATTVLGAASVELDGRSGVMLVISRSGPAAGLTLLAVGSDCDADNPQTLVRRDIG